MIQNNNEGSYTLVTGIDSINSESQIDYNNDNNDNNEDINDILQENVDDEENNYEDCEDISQRFPSIDTNSSTVNLKYHINPINVAQGCDIHTQLLKMEWQQLLSSLSGLGAIAMVRTVFTLYQNRIINNLEEEQKSHTSI